MVPTRTVLLRLQQAVKRQRRLGQHARRPPQDLLRPRREGKVPVDEVDGGEGGGDKADGGALAEAGELRVTVVGETEEGGFVWVAEAGQPRPAIEDVSLGLGKVERGVSKGLTGGLAGTGEDGSKRSVHW